MAELSRDRMNAFKNAWYALDGWKVRVRQQESYCSVGMDGHSAKQAGKQASKQAAGASFQGPIANRPLKERGAAVDCVQLGLRRVLH